MAEAANKSKEQQTDTTKKEVADKLSEEVKFSQTQKNMFDGFHEDLYGNNWFVLTTNDLGEEGLGDKKNGRSSSICGVLEKIPSLGFKTTLESGPVGTVQKLYSQYLGRGGWVGAIGSATGSNLNKQLGGNYSIRYPISRSFQEEGITLEFECWKNPAEIYDPVCLPSDMKSVISYLTRFATVQTSEQLDVLVEGAAQEVLSGALGIPILIGQAALSAVTGDSKKEVDENGNPIKKGAGDYVKSAVETVAKFTDDLVVRKWNDKQRITRGREKFNECLHRLDIMRAGVLDTYLIVAIKNWSYQFDQNALGLMMKVTINCMIDQRMNKNRLKLYSERPMFG